MVITKTSPPILGPYDCVGKQLALMEIREAVAKLVTCFDMELADREDVKWEHSGIDTFTLALPPLFINFKAH
jgi:cytochrome P450 family 628